MAHRTIFSLAEAKVRHDLASAWSVYQEKINDIQDIVHLNSLRDSIQRALVAKDRESLYRLLSIILREFKLDILGLTDEKDIVVLRVRNCS